MGETRGVVGSRILVADMRPAGPIQGDGRIFLSVGVHDLPVPKAARNPHKRKACHPGILDISIRTIVVTDVRTTTRSNRKRAEPADIPRRIDQGYGPPRRSLSRVLEIPVG